MVALIVVATLVALWLLALRYGYDSRERPWTAEEQLAARGVTWDELLLLQLGAPERRVERPMTDDPWQASPVIGRQIA